MPTLRAPVAEASGVSIHALVAVYLVHAERLYHAGNAGTECDDKPDCQVQPHGNLCKSSDLRDADSLSSIVKLPSMVCTL